MEYKNKASAAKSGHPHNQLNNTITKETRQESFITRPVSRKKDILKVMGDKEMTAREIAYALGFTERNAAAPRLTEMRSEGLVKVVGKKWDSVTGKCVAVWRAV